MKSSEKRNLCRCRLFWKVMNTVERCLSLRDTKEWPSYPLVPYTEKDTL